MPNDETILAALRTVKYPGYSRDIVSFGLVKEARLTDGQVFVVLQLNAGTPTLAEQLRATCEQAVQVIPGVADVEVEVLIPSPKAAAATGPNGWERQNGIPGVRRVVAVASGKGGVGKSTVAVNLACALQRSGCATGLLDCDIYGPSIPLMMGCTGKPEVTEENLMVPVTSHGVGLMSMGFFLDGDSAAILRAPMISKTIQQFIAQVRWGDLDYLVVDLPPGTGDAQLTLCQTVPLDGGIIVTTPQEAAVGVVRKGITMFEKVNVKILGIVENMSYFTAPGGDRVEIFGRGGGRKEAARKNLPFLGEIPLFTEIREGGDSGMPIVVGAPYSAAARCFLDLAQNLRKRLD